MNICFVTVGHVSKTRGGVDRVTDTLAHEFLKKGHRVYMISLWSSIDGDKIEKYQFFLPSQDVDSKENRSFLSHFFKEKGISVIVNQSDWSSFLNLLYLSSHNIPIISAIHSDPAMFIKGVTDNWDQWQELQGKLSFALTWPYWWIRRQYQYYTRRKYTRKKLRNWYDRSDAVVLLSSYFIPVYTRLAKIEDNSKLFAVSNPIVYPVKAAAHKEKIILFVGRLNYQKRLDRLLKVWQGIKDHLGWRILILGDGDCRSLYEDLCRRMKLTDVSFEGNTNPWNYYKKAEILCLTSTYEGFAMVILEALVNEVIPIAFESYESVHDLIEPGRNGELIPAFSILRYRRCLQRLMQDEVRRGSLREHICRCNAVERKFDAAVIAEQWLHLFEIILQKKSESNAAGM